MTVHCAHGNKALHPLDVEVVDVDGISLQLSCTITFPNSIVGHRQPRWVGLSGNQAAVSVQCKRLMLIVTTQKQARWYMREEPSTPSERMSREYEQTRMQRCSSSDDSKTGTELPMSLGHPIKGPANMHGRGSRSTLMCLVMVVRGDS